MKRLQDLSGMTRENLQKLQSVGISTSEVFLRRCASPAGQKDVAQATGINIQLIGQWVVEMNPQPSP